MSSSRPALLVALTAGALAGMAPQVQAGEVSGTFINNSGRVMALRLHEPETTFTPGLSLSRPAPAASLSLQQADEESRQEFQLQDGEAFKVTLDDQEVDPGKDLLVNFYFSFPHSGIQGDLGQMTFSFKPCALAMGEIFSCSITQRMNNLLDGDVATYRFGSHPKEAGDPHATLALIVGPVRRTRPVPSPGPSSVPALADCPASAAASSSSAPASALPNPAQAILANFKKTAALRRASAKSASSSPTWRSEAQAASSEAKEADESREGR